MKKNNFGENNSNESNKLNENKKIEKNEKKEINTEIIQYQQDFLKQLISITDDVCNNSKMSFIGGFKFLFYQPGCSDVTINLDLNDLKSNEEVLRFFQRLIELCPDEIDDVNKVSIKITGCMLKPDSSGDLNLLPKKNENSAEESWETKIFNEFGTLITKLAPQGKLANLTFSFDDVVSLNKDEFISISSGFLWRTFFSVPFLEKPKEKENSLSKKTLCLIMTPEALNFFTTNDEKTKPILENIKTWLIDWLKSDANLNMEIQCDKNLDFLHAGNLWALILNVNSAFGDKSKRMTLSKSQDKLNENSNKNSNEKQMLQLPAMSTINMKELKEKEKQSDKNEKKKKKKKKRLFSFNLGGKKKEVDEKILKDPDNKPQISSQNMFTEKKKLPEIPSQNSNQNPNSKPRKQLPPIPGQKIKFK